MYAASSKPIGRLFIYPVSTTIVNDIFPEICGNAGASIDKAVLSVLTIPHEFIIRHTGIIVENAGNIIPTITKPFSNCFPLK